MSSAFVYAGGDDRDLGPVEVLDIIVETQERTKANSTPVINTVKTPVSTEPAPIDTAVQKDNTSPVVQKTIQEQVKIINASEPVVLKKLVVEKAPVIQQKPAKVVKAKVVPVEPEPAKVAKAKIIPVKPAKVAKAKIIPTKAKKSVAKVKVKPNPIVAAPVKPVSQKIDFADKPVGHPTEPVKDIVPKIYKTCEDMIQSDSKIVQHTCAAIVGLFIIL